jgi:serine protease Do
MDEFLNNNLPEEEDEQEVSPNAEEKDFEPIYNPVNYTEVKPIEDYKPMSRGLKLFALILAAVILLTGTCLTGYLLGRNSVKISHPKVEVNLAAKPSDTDEMTEAEVYEEVNKSIVGIVAYNTSRKASQASGIVFSKEGYIVTNDHIYSDIAAAKFKIYTYDGKEYDAEYVAGDTVSDLAVLKVKGASLTPAKFGNSDDLFYGEHVVAIGRPNDATDASSITKGIVSAVNRRVQTTSNYSSRLIQTDSAINPGSSGGALVNMFGQVIGVTSSKLASVEYDAVGYAIPTTTMKRIVDELISNGKVVSRAKLGITYATIDSITAEMNGYDYKGILIDSVSEDSGLYGKAEKGDVITHINGIEITNDNIVLDIIENSRAGDKITVTIATNSGTVKTVEAKLSANIGESSYKAIEEKPEINKDGAFNFPEGE